MAVRCVVLPSLLFICSSSLSPLPLLLLSQLAYEARAIRLCPCVRIKVRNVRFRDCHADYLPHSPTGDSSWTRVLLCSEQPVWALSSTVTDTHSSQCSCPCPELSCNFEDGLCGWYQDTSDSFDWLQLQGMDHTISVGQHHASRTYSAVKWTCHNHTMTTMFVCVSRHEPDCGHVVLVSAWPIGAPPLLHSGSAP